MTRILGVDYGERRTGLAASDPTGTIAFPRETLECPLLEQAAAAVARAAAAEGATLTEEGVLSFCQALPKYKRPRRIIFADVPRNATGKIEKPKLREIYGAAGLVAAENRS